MTTLTSPSRFAAETDAAPRAAPRRSKRFYAMTRTALAFGFVFATLAVGHLLMVLINAVDQRVSPETYRTLGAESRWFGDQTVLAELEIMATRQMSPTDNAVIAKAIETVQGGGQLTVHLLNVSPFIVATTFAMIAVGLGLLVWSRHVRSDALQSVIGIFAGLLIWTGGVEYGLMIASRLLGIAKSFQIVGDRLVGAYGEYVLLKHTWGLIACVAAYLLFLETNRCPFFLWFRRRLKLMRGAIATGRIDNFAPRTSFQYVTVMWTFYVLLLWAYDETVFGVDSWLTRTIFFGSFASGGYLLLRLYRQRTMGGAVRHAIATAIICWNSVEIAAKWNLFREPWLVLRPTTAVVFFGAAALGAWLIVRELRRERA